MAMLNNQMVDWNYNHLIINQWWNDIIEKLPNHHNHLPMRNLHSLKIDDSWLSSNHFPTGNLHSVGLLISDLDHDASCYILHLHKEMVAIKFEDNQAKGNPNQLKTEYDLWLRNGPHRHPGILHLGLGKWVRLPPSDLPGQIGASHSGPFPNGDGSTKTYVPIFWVWTCICMHLSPGLVFKPEFWRIPMLYTLLNAGFVLAGPWSLVAVASLSRLQKALQGPWWWRRRWWWWWCWLWWWWWWRRP